VAHIVVLCRRRSVYPLRDVVWARSDIEDLSFGLPDLVALNSVDCCDAPVVRT
jgi:hypothetical protein